MTINKKYDLEERTLEFSKEIIRLVKKILFIELKSPEKKPKKLSIG